MLLASNFFAGSAAIEIDIDIDIDWMRLPSGMSPIDADFDFDFDSSVASRVPLFGCGRRPRHAVSPFLATGYTGPGRLAARRSKIAEEGRTPVSVGGLR